MFEKITDFAATCDLCGDKPPGGTVYINERRLCLCLTCKEKLEEAPEKLRRDIEKYLMGNVI